MTFKPYGKRLLVKLAQEEKTTTGGFIIPTKDRGDLISAKVVEVGEEIPRGLLDMTVYYRERSGETKINLEGEDYYILDEDKVLGYI